MFGHLVGLDVFRCGEDLKFKDSERNYCPDIRKFGKFRFSNTMITNWSQHYNTLIADSTMSKARNE